MNIAEIKEIISVFEESSLSLLELEEKGQKIKMERKISSEVSVALASSEKVVQATEEDPTLSSKNILVKAPLVGVFYQSSAPGETPYAKIGQIVAKGDTLCLVEAMKMMNEIKSPVSGKVISVSVANEALVSFDQVLFEIEEMIC